MKKRLRIFPKLFLYIFVFCAAFCMDCLIVGATEMADLPYIVVDGYELTKEKVIPGEEFTLTIKFHNNSKSVAAENVVINITNPNGVIPVYGEVSQVLVDTIAPGEAKEVSFNYTSMIELVGDYLDFYVSASGVTYTNVVLRVPMGVDSPFSIIAHGIPNEMYMNEMASAFVSFKVLGDENVRNVYLELQLNDKVVSKSSIGTLTSGVTRTQSLSPMVSTPGMYEAKLILYYDDETEQTQSVIVNTSVVNVIEKTVNNTDDSNSDEVPVQTDKEQEINQSILMGVGGIVILAILAVCVIAIRKRR